MRRLGYWTWTLAIAGSLALSVSGRELPDRQVSSGDRPPPSGLIQDAGGFFDSESGAIARISEKIERLKKDHGFRIFLMVEPVLIGTNAPELAARLQQSWLPEGNGMVVVFESDSRSLGCGRDVGGEPAASALASRVPTHETAAILTRALESTDSSLAPEVYIETLMGHLVTGFETYFKKRDASPPAGRYLKLGLLALGGLAFLALVAGGIAILSRLPSVAGTQSFRFPAVDRPERLGAPGGGGNVTVRRFRQP